MQRLKTSDRRLDTRRKIILGSLVIKAGAEDLPESEIVKALELAKQEWDKNAK